MMASYYVFFECDEAKKGDFVKIEAIGVHEAEEEAESYFNFHDLHNVHVTAVVPADA